MLLSPLEHMGRLVMRLGGIASRTVETGVGIHHVYDGRGTGTLPTIVLLHGFGAGATGFGPLMLRLMRETRRVFAPEAAGHGFSPRPRTRLDVELLFSSMREVLDREIDEPAIVFGNSLGGAIALSYQRESPSKVRGLVLASPAGAPSGEALGRLLSAFDLKSRRDAVALVRRLYHDPPWYAGLMASGVREVFASEPIRDVLASIRPEHAITPEQIAQLRAPTLFVWGRSEKLLPPDHLEWYRRHLPKHAEVLEPQDFGHCPHLDRPSAVARLIVDFARRVPQLPFARRG
jgi:pimeloyl-ACP methyl ester carboxylesterase